MARSKKFGGVKASARGSASSPAPVSDSAPPKKFGGVKEVPRGMSNNGVLSCPINCPGEYRLGMWIHSADCPWAAVLWSAHGFARADWKCPFHCVPITLPSGWTHPYNCEFWNRTVQTPFDTPAPKVHDYSSFPQALRLEADDLPF